MPRLDNSKNPMAIVAPTGGYDAGEIAVVSGTLCFFPEAIAATETGPAYWKDKIVRAAPKADGTGLAWVKGQELYWDGTEFTTASTGNGIVRAIAAEAAVAGATTGDVELLGTAG